MNENYSIMLTVGVMLFLANCLIGLHLNKWLVAIFILGLAYLSKFLYRHLKK
ncbi:hypothetical protein [Pseudolactococcus raffinolactis]|jgi:hypothetical protein|uniref:Uncharacterized protein n=1 Tax=Pseudolactococcus raffinolactis TaxID=1366 RepID=A0A2A5SA70_9LACT|nr:hypothetical protein [Lactococcus raffinolactis]MBR2541383.1 hypothetical protein [Lactococcus sp.]PCS10364.1 hypothetical protein RU88_GL000855 [Lactococcus raffinolactis]QIW51061.1 hypothetical protein GU337_03805 [Lactococcus raffinolactis]QIW53477.1 hypothetical protein GU336_04590 [Lactococcus raffinolactis]QIW60214.1 hypothetical protein GU333_03325 [Lactococcus raffinolactis]